MEGIVSTLQNAYKMEELILKLKTLGEESPQFQQFKTCMDAFNLNKTPRGFDQQNILQTTFQFCDARECFESFRLVCKPWQNAIETIRLDREPEKTLVQDLLDAKRHGVFPLFYHKYVKLFKKLYLHFPSDMSADEWNSLKQFLLKNVKKVKTLKVVGQMPPQFTFFLFKIFENLQSTLQTFGYYSKHLIVIPTVSLPQLETFRMPTYANHNQQVEMWEYFMKNFIANVSQDFKFLNISRINRAPNVLQYLAKNFATHFVFSPNISVLEHIPFKISHFCSLVFY
jgi:hypothetical protein